MKQAVSSISIALEDLSSSLEAIEENYYKKFQYAENKRNRCERCMKKLKELSLMQKPQERVMINAGGKVFETMLSTIKDCKYRNLLQESEDEMLKMGELGKAPVIMLDIDSNVFEVLLEIIRLSGIQSESEVLMSKKLTIREGNFHNNSSKDLEKAIIRDNIVKFFTNEADHEEIFRRFSFEKEVQSQQKSNA